MAPSLRRGLVPVLVCAAASCAEAPPPPPAPVRLDAPAPTAAVPPPAPARWVESGGVTMIGPQVARGTLVLLGGRRALVLADGAVEMEKATVPEPLQDVLLVPGPAGTRLVGRGVHDVYRFDDPLGAPTVLARSEAMLTRIGAGPGVIAVWAARSDLPRFVDVETGKERALAGLPELPLRAVAFVDAQKGAGVFEAVGLAVTTDGGHTWRPAAGSGPRDALAVSGVRRRGEALRAFAYADGPDGAVDLDHARVGAMEAPASAATEPAMLRWIRVSGRDPLEAAASGGLDLPAGGALIASHGMVARIDPKSGTLGELVEIARGKWVPCSAGRASGAAWIACSLPDAKGSDAHPDAGEPFGPPLTRLDLFDPFGVFRVPLSEPKLTPERPVLVRNGEADLRVSPSGGVMLTAPCSGEDAGQACARQPDGKWKTINANVELGERGPGPLADGRIAFLRGLFDGDEPEAAAGGAPGEEEDPGRTKRLHVAVLGPGGKEHALAPIPFTPSRGYVHVQSPIEEDVDHALHFVIEDGEGPYAVTVPAGRESPSAQRIPDAAEARLRAGRGLAVSETHVLASLDGGATWNEVPATPAAIEAARAVASGTEGPDAFSVSEIGARIGPMLRLGWGPPESASSSEPPPPPAPLADLATPATPPAAPELLLTCTSSGPAPGLPPLLGMAEAKPLLAGKPKEPAKPGPKHESSVWAARINALETVAMIEEDAPDKDRKGTSPLSWTFRWHDPREIGGKVRSASVKIPAGASGGTNLRFAASDGARALFAVRSGGKFRLVRVKGAGAAEAVEIPQDLLPTGEVVFGTDKGEPIAWLHETHVVAWLAGDKPRVVAELSTHAPRSLGTPTAAGVPLIVGSADWALLRTLPIPALDKASPDKAPPPVPVTLDGWTRLPPLKRALGALPACGAKAKGAQFVIERSGLRAEIDGVSQSGSAARYEVRVTGNDVCVEGLSAMLTVGRTKGGGPKAPPPGKPGAKPPAPAAGSGASFVRVDLLGKKAEGGTRGLLPDAEVRRMSCALAPKG
ncbi:MAG: hypothetical protein QM820_09815 [Minicystis sp.]